MDGESYNQPLSKTTKNDGQNTHPSTDLDSKRSTYHQTLLRNSQSENKEATIEPEEDLEMYTFTSTSTYTKSSSLSLKTSRYLLAIFLILITSQFAFQTASAAQYNMEDGTSIHTAGKEIFDDYEAMERKARPQFRSRHFTLLLMPREESCFTANLIKDDTLTINMQVLRGGDNKAMLFVRDPATKKNIDAKLPTKNVNRVMKIPKDGSFDICVSNKVSSLHKKVVSIDMSISQEQFEGEEYYDEDGGVESEKTIKDPETEADDPFRNDDDQESQLEEDFKKIVKLNQRVSMVQVKLGRSRLLIMRHRGMTMKDAYFQTDQLYWVNLWSTIVCTCLILVYITEVHLIKRWFRDDSKNKSKQKFYHNTGMKMGL